MSRYLSSLVFILLSLSSKGQELKEPEIIPDWKPSMIFFSADLVGLTRLGSSNNLKSEFSAKMDFDRFFLAFDYGLHKTNFAGNNFDYSSNGSFFRIGPQIDFMRFNKGYSNLYFGVMFATSSFDDRIDYIQNGGFWDGENLSFANKQLKANWFELNLGISAKIIGPLYLGYTIRFKLAKSLSGEEELRAFEVPGFGTSGGGSTFGFNYYITYRFGMRKKEVPEKPKRAKRLESESNSKEDEP
jgi:hypothetical protein